MPHSSRETARTRFSMALEQGGYFTAKQAKAAGYDYPHFGGGDHALFETKERLPRNMYVCRHHGSRGRDIASGESAGSAIRPA